MGKMAGRQTAVLVGKRNLSTYFNSAESVGEAAALEVTGLTEADRKFIVGLKGATVALAGFYDGAANAVEEALSEGLGSAAGEPVMIAPSGLTVGNRVRCLLARKTRFSVQSPVVGFFGVAADVQASEGIRFGHSLHALGEETATGNSASVDNVAASSNGAVAQIHVTAANDASGTSNLTVIVQGSTTGAFAGEETTVATFAVLGASTTSERVAVTGTIPRYLREKRTEAGVGTGAWTYAVAVGRG